MNATGVLNGLGAALLFGLATPIAKRLLPGMGPLLLAGILYLGAGLGLGAYSLVRNSGNPDGREAPLRRGDLGWLLGIIGLGGVAGPILLFVGLGRITGILGSLLLNLETPLTILMAVSFFGDHLGRREALSVAVIVLAAAILGLDPGTPGARGFDWIGGACVTGACLCWALDNNFTQRLSLRDPIAVVRIKGLCAGSLCLLIAITTGGAIPSAATVALAALLGIASYGVSVVLYLRAVRTLGTARQSALFAAAPFVGAVAAVPILNEHIHPIQWLAMMLMGVGVVFLLRARHGHRHTHEALEHEHLHVHDEHHRHSHEGAIVEPHSHPHRHLPLTHDHPHTPDLHHRHPH